MPAITIDTAQLTYPLVAVQGPGNEGGGVAFVDGSADPPPEVGLPAGTGYRLRLGDGTTAAVAFDVHEDGTLAFAPEYDAFLGGRGGRRLTVRGAPVVVDARSLDHPLAPDLPGAAPLSPDRTHALRLLPASGYRLRVEAGTADGELAFSVTLDGGVTPASESAGFASAVGGVLTVRGRTVTVDGRGLSHGLLPVGAGTFLPPDTVHRLTLLPAAGYVFLAGPGVAADFSYTVRPDGTVDYDASCDRFLSGRGTGTLVVGGFPVVLSAAGADSDILGLEGLPDPAPRPPRELAAVLVPAKGYQPRTAYGVCSGFRVGRDGTPAADPAGARSYRAGDEGPRAAAEGPPAGLTVRIARAVPGGPPPRGRVAFTADGRPLGTVLLDGVGLASLRTAAVPAGTREIVVAYEGDDAHRPCTTTLRLREGA
ncbi:Ig-like domain-containing protein [Streptomyces mobaraensis]|uniref:Ig-like domain repeat protein n=1 Tax=Streptomyces mobaraensis TaxID=35621 RepID=A0A5N5VYD7_STRMB|nr:Ig-like domain-containing protein [Streptomyces mobaraensis]KAB7833817.1 Ig-like domain repeat protein [Streptomyces mobaraensis]